MLLFNHSMQKGFSVFFRSITVIILLVFLTTFIPGSCYANDLVTEDEPQYEDTSSPSPTNESAILPDSTPGSTPTTTYTTTPTDTPTSAPTSTPTSTPKNTPVPLKNSPSPTPSQNVRGSGTNQNIKVSPTMSPGNMPKPTNYLEDLKKLGYYKEFSKDARLNQRSAITLFQSSSNLKVDGIWGKQSQEILDKKLKNPKLSVCDAVYNPPGNDKWIVINLTKRSLTLYSGKQVLKKYPVAVANPPTLTPEGKFKIVVKAINPTWGGGGYAKPIKGGSPRNPLGYRWLGLSPKGGGSYGIHGTNSPYSIGTNASHGCIRMLNFCVEELYPLVNLKTPVWIGTESTLKGWGVIQNPL